MQVVGKSNYSQNLRVKRKHFLTKLVKNSKLKHRDTKDILMKMIEIVTINQIDNEKIVIIRITGTEEQIYRLYSKIFEQIKNDSRFYVIEVKSQL